MLPFPLPLLPLLVDVAVVEVATTADEEEGAEVPLLLLLLLLPPEVAALAAFITAAAKAAICGERPPPPPPPPPPAAELGLVLLWGSVAVVDEGRATNAVTSLARAEATTRAPLPPCASQCDLAAWLWWWCSCGAVLSRRLRRLLLPSAASGRPCC